MLRHLVAVGFAVLTTCWAGGPTVALALPAGHVPVYLIPFVKSISSLVPTTVPFLNAVTVISITRVGGTAACDVSVDWRDDLGTTVAATTISTLTPPSATSLNVGDGDHHCSHSNLTQKIVSCEVIASGLTGFQGKAVVGAKAPCNGNTLAVDARVIYLDAESQLPVAIHSLRVLKPHNVGNKGD